MNNNKECDGDFCEMCPIDVYMKCLEKKMESKNAPDKIVQSRVGSITEILLNVGTGLLTSNLCWHFIVLPLYPKLATETVGNIFVVNLIFTFISILRSYAFRRLFCFLRKHNIWSKA